MTLVLTVLTQKYVVQVSDRRVTCKYPDGKIVVADDNENKAIHVIGASCHFAVSYTGSARIGHKSFDDWLSGKIATANVGRQPYEKLKAEVCGPVIEELKRVAKRSREGRIDTTIIMSGFRTETNSKTVCFLDWVSTAKSRESLRRHSEKILISKKQEHIIAHGTVWAINRSITRKIRALSACRFFRQESGETVARVIVELIREAANDHKYGKFIGKDCMEIVVQPDPRIVSCRRHVYEPEKPPYPKEVTGSPIIVVGNCSLSFRTNSPTFTLNNLEIGNNSPAPPPKEGQIPFRVIIPDDGGMPWREY